VTLVDRTVRPKASTLGTEESLTRGSVVYALPLDRLREYRAVVFVLDEKVLSFSIHVRFFPYLCTIFIYVLYGTFRVDSKISDHFNAVFMFRISSADSFTLI
jgi:hypothetical protein